jgi:hypothetical protein
MADDLLDVKFHAGRTGQRASSFLEMALGGHFKETCFNSQQVLAKFRPAN